MPDKICGSCKHFRAHYIKMSKNYYSPLYYGHCVHPRIKKRETATKACKYYEEHKVEQEACEHYKERKTGGH